MSSRKLSVDGRRLWDIMSILIVWEYGIFIVIFMLLEVGYRGYIDVISKWDIMDVLLV